MTIQTHVGETVVTTTVTIETIEITEGLIAYRQTDSSVTKGRTNNTQHPIRKTGVTREGVLDAANLAKKLAGKAFEERRYAVWDDATIEQLRQWGWDGMQNLARAKEIEDRENKRPVVEEKEVSVFEAFATGTAKPHNLIRFDSSSNMVFDHTGRLLPTGIIFDYMTGLFDNGHYDLAKAAAHLMGRDDMIVARNTDMRDGYAAREGLLLIPAAGSQEAIQPIPYYNAQRGRSRHIVFAWRPKDEDWEKLIAALPLDKTISDPTTKQPVFWDKMVVSQKIFELDLFGLRAAGAALFDNFYTSVEVETPDDDDD